MITELVQICNLILISSNLSALITKNIQIYFSATNKIQKKTCSIFRVFDVENIFGIGIWSVISFIEITII